MRRIVMAGAVAAAMAAGLRASEQCIYTGGSYITGQVRVCVYTCPGGNVPISIPSWEICPAYITR